LKYIIFFIKQICKDTKKRDNEALSLIRSAMDEAIFPRISIAESSKVAWGI